MSVSSLNVSIGAKIEGLQKGLRQAERELRQAGQRLANAGDQLTQTLTLSIGALGLGAIKAAGDFEALRLAMRSTFEGAGRSIQQADKELEALRKSALAPGLDFEQAVKASIRLQAVGLSAENARDTIEELANAVATTGGTAANLESVTVQMSQMISKGKVLSQDLRIIQENLPAISGLMKKAFGTSNAEDLQKLGITGKEFVDKITVEMAKLPRVSGGLQNAIVNAGSAIKQFLAGIGAEIAKAFNLTAKSEEFSKWLQDAAMWFKNLDDSTKRTIIQIGLFVTALGPAMKVLSVMKGLSSQAIGGIRDLGGMAKSLIGTFLSLAETIKSVRGALALFGGGVALAAVAAIAGAVYLLADNMSAAEIAAREFNKAQKEINSEYANQTAALNKNIDVLRNVNSTTEERKNAINALKSAYPDYLKNINLETASNEKLTRVQQDLNKEILQGVVERQRAVAITAIYEEQAKLLLRINELRKGAKATAGEATLIDTGDMVRAGSIAGAVIKKMEQQAADLKTEAEKVGKQFDETFGVASAPRRFTPIHDLTTATADLGDKTDDTTKKVADHTKTVKEAETEYDGAIRRVGQWAKSLLGLKSVQKAAADQLALIHQPVGDAPGLPGDLQTAPTPDLGAPLQLGKNIMDALTPAQVLLQNLHDGVVSFSDAFKQASDIVAVSGTAMEGAVFGAAQAMYDAAASGATSFKDLGKAALKGAADVVRAKIMEATAIWIADSLAKFGIIGVAIAAAGAAVVGTLFNVALKSLKIPAFAHGTNNAPGGLSLVGELGPELVNLPRGSQVTPNSKLNGMLSKSNDVNVSGTFRVQGTDLLLVMERAQNRSQRTRGF